MAHRRGDVEGNTVQHRSVTPRGPERGKRRAGRCEAVAGHGALRHGVAEEGPRRREEHRKRGSAAPRGGDQRGDALARIGDDEDGTIRLRARYGEADDARGFEDGERGYDEAARRAGRIRHGRLLPRQGAEDLVGHRPVGCDEAPALPNEAPGLAGRDVAQRDRRPGEGERAWQRGGADRLEQRAVGARKPHRERGRLGRKQGGEPRRLLARALAEECKPRPRRRQRRLSFREPQREAEPRRARNRRLRHLPLGVGERGAGAGALVANDRERHRGDEDERERREQREREAHLPLGAHGSAAPASAASRRASAAARSSRSSAAAPASAVGGSPSSAAQRA